MPLGNYLPVKASIFSWQLGEGARDTLCVWEGEVECIA